LRTVVEKTLRKSDRSRNGFGKRTGITLNNRYQPAVCRPDNSRYHAGKFSELLRIHVLLSVQIRERGKESHEKIKT